MLIEKDSDHHDIKMDAHAVSLIAIRSIVSAMPMEGNVLMDVCVMIVIIWMVILSVQYNSNNQL